MAYSTLEESSAAARTEGFCCKDNGPKSAYTVVDFSSPYNYYYTHNNTDVSTVLSILKIIIINVGGTEAYAYFFYYL